MPAPTKTVVLTGASAGVGRATARRFGARGDNLVLVARGRAGLDAAVADVEQAGGRAVAVQADVADPEAVERAADAAEEMYGPIDVWVNNAMSTMIAPFDDVTAEDFKRVTEVTYLGSVHGFQSALRRMVPRDHGTIVQVGSALAFRGIPLQAAYCGAKHALQGVTESLQAELRHDGSGVRIVAVHLPGLNTPQFTHCKTTLDVHPQPVAPIYQPEVAADGIVYGAESSRETVFVGDSTFLTVWGNRIAPRFVEWYLSRTNVTGQKDPQLPYDPGRADNLYHPTDDLTDEGSHGPFDDEARSSSPYLAATRHPVATLGAVTAGLGAAAYGLNRLWS